MVDQEMLAEMRKMIGKILRAELREIKTKIDKLDERTEQLESDTRYVKIVQAGNHIMHRQDSIEQCYADTSARYLEQKERIDRLTNEIYRLSKVINGKDGHSEEAQG